MVNKDKPQTWRRYTASLCQSCLATCCTMPIEIKGTDLVQLGLADAIEIEESPQRVAKQLIKSGIIKSYREKTGLFLVQSKANGDCRFLDSTNRRCTVYEKRPQMCREFPERAGNRIGHCPYLPITTT